MLLMSSLYLLCRRRTLRDTPLDVSANDKLRRARRRPGAAAQMVSDAELHNQGIPTLTLSEDDSAPTPSQSVRKYTLSPLSVPSTAV